MKVVHGLMAAAVLAGCGSPDPNRSPPTTSPPPRPCATLTSVSLGKPGPDGPAAQFRAPGGSLLIAASGFDHTSPLSPDIGSTEVSIGVPTAPPDFDPRAGTVHNALWRLTVHEDRPTQVNLPSGVYWLVTSNTVEIGVTPCGPKGIEVLHPRTNAS